MSYAERATGEDCGAGYEALRQELIALVRGLDPTAQAQTVPATPAWTVRDVLGHVTGITEDLNHGNFDVTDTDAWTRAQVERHRDEPLEATIAAWDAEAPTFERGLRELGYEIGSHYIADLLIHLVDVRAALDLPIEPDAPLVWIALDFYLETLDRDLADAHVGALAVETGIETRVVGPGDVAASVTTEPFEMLRACAGRRTADAIAAYRWSGDVDAFVGRISRYETPSTGVGV
jgi:uncharacterized protein (TIGR03083 family)